MRTRRKWKKRIILTSLLLSVCLISYIIGYGQGQSDVYTKASNDKKLMHILYGSE